MPTYTNTAKYLLRKLTGANLVSDVDAGIAALADDIDGNMAGYSQGVLASRPVSTGGTPGIAGRFYRAIDAGPGTNRLYQDTGTSWVEVATVQRLSQAWDPPSVATGAATSTTVALATFPSLVSASFSQPIPAGAFLVSHYDVTLAAVRVTLVNLSGSAVDLASGTLSVAAVLS